MEGQGDDSSSEEDVDDTKLLDEAEAVLKDLNAEVSQPATGVFQQVNGECVTRRMAFMKRALEKQREEARLDAERLMQALQEEEEFDDDKKEESLQEESAQAAKIREVLSSGRKSLRYLSASHDLLLLLYVLTSNPTFFSLHLP